MLPAFPRSHSSLCAIWQQIKFFQGSASGSVLHPFPVSSVYMAEKCQYLLALKCSDSGISSSTYGLAVWLGWHSSIVCAFKFPSQQVESWDQLQCFGVFFPSALLIAVSIWTPSDTASAMETLAGSSSEKPAGYFCCWRPMLYKQTQSLLGKTHSPNQKWKTGDSGSCLVAFRLLPSSLQGTLLPWSP